MKTNRIFVLVLLLAVLFTLSGCGGMAEYSSRIPDAPDTFYVLDTAGVITPATRNHIISRNDALFALSGAQIVVVCVPTTEGMDISEYAVQLFNKWGIGSAEKNNGALLLLSIQDDNYWALQGKGLEEILSSGTLKQMINADLEPHFAAKEYDAGVMALFQSIYTHLCTVYNISPDTWSGAPGPYTQGGTEPASEESGTLDILIWAILIVIVILIIAAYFNSASGSGPKNRGGGSGGRRRTTTRTYVGPMYGGNFGGYPRHRPAPPRPQSYNPRPGGFSGGSRGGFSGGSRGGFSGGSRGGFSGGGRSGGGGISRGGGVGRR